MDATAGHDVPSPPIISTEGFVSAGEAMLEQGQRGGGGIKYI